MQEVTVTELSRGLSEFINRATYLGETFLIVRAGKPVAHLAPIPAGARVKDLHAIFDPLPALDPIVNRPSPGATRSSCGP